MACVYSGAGLESVWAGRHIQNRCWESGPRGGLGEPAAEPAAAASPPDNASVRAAGNVNHPDTEDQATGAHLCQLVLR